MSLYNVQIFLEITQSLSIRKPSLDAAPQPSPSWRNVRNQPLFFLSYPACDIQL